GQLDQTDMRERDARFLCLQAIKTTVGFWSTEKRGACLLASGIGFIALGVVTGAAVGAIATGDGGTDHDAIADIQVAHILAQGFDNTYSFVAENTTFVHATDGATYKVQIGTANG